MGNLSWQGDSGNRESNGQMNNLAEQDSAFLFPKENIKVEGNQHYVEQLLEFETSKIEEVELAAHSTEFCFSSSTLRTHILIVL